jgi:hypothetical protein
MDLPVKTSVHPSPSNDPWFNDHDNIASVMRGIEDAKQGRMKTYSEEQIKSLLGV